MGALIVSLPQAGFLLGFQEWERSESKQIHVVSKLIHRGVSNLSARLTEKRLDKKDPFVGRKLCVCRQQAQRFNAALGDQQSIKWIMVMIGQRRDGDGMANVHRQEFESSRFNA